MANAYPGIYQGLITSCSYPDTFTAGAQFADYHLLRLYFEDPTRWAPGVVWLPTQMAQVEGHLSHLNAVVADEGLFKAALNPENACPGTTDPVAGDPTTRYDSETNPGGVRCSVLDLLVNQLGPRPESVWTPQEKAAGHGFGGLPFANTGVLYGLSALKAGTITPPSSSTSTPRSAASTSTRSRPPTGSPGDPASIANAYRTGLINEANHLDEVAMINHGGPDPGLAHDYAHAFWTEERLQADQGNTDNRVMWFGPTPLIGDVGWATEALTKMDALAHRGREGPAPRKPLAAKIVADRPADVTDRCVVDQLAQVCDVEELQVLQTRLVDTAPGGRRPARQRQRRLPARRRSTRPTSTSCSCRSPTPSGPRCRRSSPTASATGRQPGIGQGPAQTWLRYDAPRRRCRVRRPQPARRTRSLRGRPVVSPVCAPMLRK